MTDVNVQWMRCARKRAFGSRKIAKGHCDFIRKRYGREMGVYPCEDCGQFHLFNVAKREATRKRRREQEAA